ncbi:MAG: nucleoside phosphorylase [Ilumatobacteraceae bacterium]
MTTEPDTVLPILNVRAGDVPERILVVGDPARATRVSTLLDDVREISRNREYVMYGGTHQGEAIGVVSHGVGSPGAAACFEELCRGGARRIVRAGTTGGLQPDVVDGDLVVARAAVREEGVTSKIVPLSFPAVASLPIIQSLTAGAERRNVRMTEGIVLTSDLFYPYPVLGDDLAMWAEAGVVAVEMECSALFVVAAMHGVETGAILTVDGNPLAENTGDMSDYDPHRPIVDSAVASMVEIALDTVAMPL